MNTGSDATEPVPAEDQPGRDAGTPSPLEGQTRLHNGHGRFERSPQTVERDARAAELRGEGWKLEDIATELGYADKSCARRGIHRALRDIVQGPAEKLLAVHMDRLEFLYAEALEVLEADHIVVSHGQVVRGDDGQPLTDHTPKLAAIREARSTLDSFWTLTGMKKPAKVEHSGGVKYELIGVDPENLT